jgi:thioredoxin-related protein
MKRFVYAISGLAMLIGLFFLTSFLTAQTLTSNEDKLISDALKQAKQNDKYVLLQSSANGCTWCHVLQNLLTTNPQLVAKIKSDFIYALVDTTNDQNRDFYKKYAENTDHTLVLVILDANGNQLARKIGFDIVEANPTKTNGDYYINSEHVLAFLNEWSPKK